MCVLIECQSSSVFFLSCNGASLPAMSPGVLCLTWLSVCVVRRCSPLFPPDNGYMKCDSDGDNYGATCDFKCTGGYELQGSAARVCQYGLTWSGTDTTCARTYCMHINTHTLTQTQQSFIFLNASFCSF